MAHATASQLCPRGHLSADVDYCSECGARIEGVPPEETSSPGAEQQRPVPRGQVCPDCTTVREQPEITFCEVCGFNYLTGARGEIPAVPAPSHSEIAAAPAEPAAEVQQVQQPLDEVPPMSPEATSVGEDAESHPQSHWVLRIEVDPTLRGTESPEAPEHFAPVTILLEKPVSLVGRVDENRGIFPEIVLTHDEAVSRRHALLQLEPDTGRLLLRDIGASNGTRLNGTDVPPMVDREIKAGDEITLGHWSRIHIERQ